MNKKSYSIILILALLGILWFWRGRHPDNEVARPQLSGGTDHKGELLKSVDPAATAADPSKPTPEGDFAAWNEKRLKQREAAQARNQDEWRTPI